MVITKSKLEIFKHLLVWVVLLSIPYILSYGQEQNIYRTFTHFWVPIVFYAVIYYSNYFVLIDRYLFKNEIVLYVLINILIIAICITIKEQIEIYVETNISPNTDSEDKGPPIKMMIYVQMLSNMAPLLFAIALKTTQRWVKTEAERKEASNFQLQTELQHLRYQLQPHFFFNALNNIYAMVDLSPEDAKISIHSLSKLMRYMLYETNADKITLSKEIEFMTQYIELMKLRISDKTQVYYNFPEGLNNIFIPPLLFISLIENAFKHGVSANINSEIHISMNVENDTILFKTQNRNFRKNSKDKSGSGIGLENLKKRLNLLYPNKHKFDIRDEEDQFTTILSIEL